MKGKELYFYTLSFCSTYSFTITISTISPAISKKYREALQENKQNLLISQNKQRAAGQFVADILEIFEESPGNIEHPAS